MHVQNPMEMTIGEWDMIVRAWSKAHAKNGGVQPPTEEEFERAVLAARSVH